MLICHLLWFGYGLSPKGSCTGSLVLNVMILNGGGTFRERGLVGGVFGHGAPPSEGVNVHLLVVD